MKSFHLIFESYAQNRLEDLFYIIPDPLSLRWCVRIVLFSEIAIIFSLVYSAALAFSFDGSLRISCTPSRAPYWGILLRQV